MAYRARILQRRGSSRAPASGSDVTATSSSPSLSSMHGRGLGRPGRQPAATTITANSGEALTAAAPALATRGRTPIYIGRLARQSVMVAESDTPAAEGIVM
jgi:hypothetical protein